MRILLSNPLATYSLLVVITDPNDVQYNFPYDNVEISGESNSYRLKLGRYLGQLTDPFMASNHTEFQCWPGTNVSSTRRRGYCNDIGHTGSGCWWFSSAGGRLCGNNNLNDENPYWGIFNSQIKSVEMKIKRN